jgi:hypothetical protein
MDALYKYVTTVAFAHNVVTPSEDIDHFIFYVNDILSEVNTSYNQRMAQKKKEDPTDTGYEPSELSQPDSGSEPANGSEEGEG